MANVVTELSPIWSHLFVIAVDEDSDRMSELFSEGEFEICEVTMKYSVSAERYGGWLFGKLFISDKTRADLSSDFRSFDRTVT